MLDKLQKQVSRSVFFRRGSSELSKLSPKLSKFFFPVNLDSVSICLLNVFLWMMV